MAISPLSSSIPAAALNPLAQGKLPAIAFGKAEWEKYVGDIGVEPPLPGNIYQILQSPCPFQPGKTIGETHLLTLIPRTVDRDPLTLNSLCELVKNPKQGHKLKSGYWLFYEPVESNFGDTPNPNSYWVLVSKEIIPNSLAKRYEVQLQLLQEFNQRSPIQYEAPTMQEAATSILMEYIRSGNRLYKNDHNACPTQISTNCREIVTIKAPMHTTVGGLNEDGILITLNVFHEMTVVGLAAAHRF